jgi:NSS family neurotransmitter:Na+ symporter
MTELLEEQRESWGTRSGFVLAAIGSAVGLGNLWGFPYKLYDNGGAAFLIPYIFAIFVVGVPILILEFSLGHFTQRAAPDAFARGHKKLEFVGWWGIILGFVIVTFYPVILAYCFSFLWYSVQGIFNGGKLPWAGEGLAGVEKAHDFFYNEYLQHTDGFGLGAIRSNIFISLCVTWIVMYLCIFKGVNIVGKIVWLTVPLPWLMLLILTVNGLLLPGSIKGLAYYLNPDWTQLAKPTTWQFAFGQAFFSLSLAFGVMVTYASFLHRRSDINNNAAVIGIADFATSFIAGLAIFATLGGMSYVTAQAGNPVAVENVINEGEGPGLAFVAFPYALAQLPGSAIWSCVFFFTLVTLGVDSAFSITESVLAAIVDKTRWKRGTILVVMSLIGLTFGIVFTTRGGLNWLGVVVDAVYGTWGIGFVGLSECILLGWLWRIDHLRRHANDRSDWKLGLWWDHLIRIFIPIILGTLFFWNLFSDLTKENGLLRDKNGDLLLPNCVGMAIMLGAPILAIAFSWLKGAREQREYLFSEDEYQTRGRSAGIAILLLTLVSTILVFILFKRMVSDNFHNIWSIFLPLLPAILAILLANKLLNKHNRSRTQVSWFARWAGMIATMNTAACMAMLLINLTGNASIEVTKPSHSEKLSPVSYLILSVVLLLVVFGLGWCFYRAVTATAGEEKIQHADEIGNVD